MNLLVFFPSIQYGLVIILWLTDESQELGLSKVIDVICYSQTTNLAFIDHTSILIYMFDLLHII